MQLLKEIITASALLGAAARALPQDLEPRDLQKPADALLDPAGYKAQDIIRRDVAVIGGGSAGTNAAIQLHDRAKSVVIIDRKTRLGGHAETYTDPRTGTTIDIGVVVYPKVKVAMDYLDRLGISLANVSSPPRKSSYVNFDTGKKVDFQPPSQSDAAAAFKAYTEQITRYPTLQASFNMTYPVAEELLMPFGDFVKKYKLDGMMFSVFQANQGYVPLLKLPTLYMIKYLNEFELGQFKDGFLTTKNHNVAELYDAAAKVLGADNLLFNSQVIGMDRSKSPVRIAVATPLGRKLVLACKLISAIPPKVDNLKGYDLSSNERELFGQFKANGYYTGLLKETGLATPNLSYSNVDKSQPYNVPPRPGIYTLSVDIGSNLTHVYTASETPQSDETVKKQVETDINRVREQQGMPKCQLEWVIFSNHAPFNLHVSTRAIADGFYKKLYGLNGQRNTFWTGAAFQAQDSAKIWQYNEEFVLPSVFGSLDA